MPVLAMERGKAKKKETPQLSRKQEEVLQALLSLPSITAAARSVGVHERTVRRWLKQPLFEQAYKEAQQNRFSESLSMLQAGVGTAIRTLLQNMTGEDVPAGVKVRAAQIWLEQSIEQHKTRDLEQRLEEFLDLAKGKTL
jgi:DNA-binding transcriptional MerR regulator